MLSADKPCMLHHAIGRQAIHAAPCYRPTSHPCCAMLSADKPCMLRHASGRVPAGCKDWPPSVVSGRLLIQLVDLLRSLNQPVIVAATAAAHGVHSLITLPLHAHAQVSAVRFTLLGDAGMLHGRHGRELAMDVPEYVRGKGKYQWFLPKEDRGAVMYGCAVV
eukprot:358723-Chlamydomonas_euryale.AAC.9